MKKRKEFEFEFFHKKKTSLTEAQKVFKMCSYFFIQRGIQVHRGKNLNRKVGKIGGKKFERFFWKFLSEIVDDFSKYFLGEDDLKFLWKRVPLFREDLFVRFLFN